MKPSSSLVAFLLVLHLLLHGAYGARLGKIGTQTANTEHTNFENNNTNAMKKDGNNNNNNIIIGKKEAEVVEVVCDQDEETHCSSSKGKNRKLITTTTMSTSIAKPIQEKMENGANKNVLARDAKAQNLSSSSIHSPSPDVNHDEHRKVVPRNNYEDLIDMTEMDYSPAKRKPPIHN